MAEAGAAAAAASSPPMRPAAAGLGPSAVLKTKNP